jgi:hypothetical protein
MCARDALVVARLVFSPALFASNQLENPVTS